MDALEPGHRVVLARFQRAPGAMSVDLGAEMRYIVLDKITELHDGGAPVFGPDGRLYVAFGDGGPHEDPVHAQDAETLLGSLLRVDVPADDAIEAMTEDPRPFLGSPPEILAIGLRNPWRYSFDRASGDFIIADVGYETREEVSRLPAEALKEVSERPLNLGWPCFEGSAPYLDDGRCEGRALTGPVLQYGHDQGFAITGGFVYRGSEMNALTGRYVYGDFVNGRIWSVDAEVLQAPALQSVDAASAESGTLPSPSLARHLSARLELESGLNISGFAEDPAGELYLISYADGTVRRLRWADR
jgi:glucose/arabinose dehydrogenase